MKRERLSEHNLKWIPIHKRKSRLPGGPKPHQIGEPESRVPLLWIARDEVEEYEHSLYLVNDSGEVLEKVVPDTGGFITFDDDVHPVSSKEKIVYENVQPGEAVKVDDIDIFYDSDFVLGVSVEIKSSSLGHIQFDAFGQRGGIGETVLLWDNLEAGKGIVKKHLD